jgi:hypothetical protein
MNYDSILKHYERGLWSKKMVGRAVKRGIITPQQYEEITKEPYPIKEEK